MISSTAFILLVAQAAGLPPGWDVKPQAEKIVEEVGRLRPLIERLQPATWVSAGAPSGYEKQWKDCLNGIDYVQNAATRLASEPEKLSIALETLVRLEAILEHANSLTQGVRRYQNPAVAEILESEMSAAGASRGWLRQYTMELAQQREKELTAAEQEAQRCRGQLVRPGARK